MTVAHSMRLAVAPVAGLVPIPMAEANTYLVEWGHDLGPCNRSFRMEGWALEVAGRVVSVAVSASAVSPTVPTPWHTYGRAEVVDLARLCSDPDQRWATRPMLRLWREVAAPLWPCWTVKCLVSYSTRRHSGDLYRWDGWTLCAEDAGYDGRGGTWGAARPADSAGAGNKRRWAYRMGQR